MSMKNLVQRMRISHKENLFKAKESYPHSITPVIEELERNHFWSDLTYDTVSVLVSHLGLKGYDPCYVAEVFDNR